MKLTQHGKRVKSRSEKNYDFLHVNKLVKLLVLMRRFILRTEDNSYRKFI